MSSHLDVYITYVEWTGELIITLSKSSSFSSCVTILVSVFFYEDRTKQQFNLNGAASSLSPHHHICLCGPYATLHPLHLQRPAERWDLTFDRQIALSATLTVEEHGVMCKNSCHDYIDIISGKQKWGLLDRGSVQIPTVRTHWLEIMRKKKRKGFELVQDNVCVISIADDRDDSHAVALSIQYS